MKEYRKLEIEVVCWGEDVYTDVIQSSGNNTLSAEQSDNNLSDFFD